MSLSILFKNNIKFWLKKESYQNKNKNLFFTCKYLNLAINNFVLKQMIKI